MSEGPLVVDIIQGLLAKGKKVVFELKGEIREIWMDGANITYVIMADKGLVYIRWPQEVETWKLIQVSSTIWRIELPPLQQGW